MLPSIGEDSRLTLGEGDTPLIKSRQLGPSLGLENLYFKLEMLNPSGSYKDRFAACAVSGLLQRGVKFCLATSSGNTGSALAAYCAAANIKCYLVIVDGAPAGKIQQMQLYGAETMMVKDFGKDFRVTEQVFSELNDMAHRHGTQVQISAYHYSPLGMAGVQTIAYEIAEQIPVADAHIFSPAGGGGLTLALTKGFQTWKEHHADFKIPRVHCVQPEGNDTISSPLRNGWRNAREISKTATLISGLQVPNIIDGNEVITACRASGGTGYAVPDELIYESQRDMATREGIFCEPAGAVGFSALCLALKNKEINAADHIVCLVTGHGFKDLVAAAGMAEKSAGHYFKDCADTFQHIKAQIQNNNKANFK